MDVSIVSRMECDMPLKLMYITNNPEIAKIAEKNGVDRIWVDLESRGKEQRQRNRDTVKSHHTIADVKAVSEVLDTSELMVRINPWDKDSTKEIEAVIDAGAKRIMLPMWENVDEVNSFLSLVNERAQTTLLLETKEAVECLDEVLELPLIDEIHIGLNDLHLSYGLTFMFELLSNGIVEEICKKCAAKQIPYGFGGVARIGEGMLPAEQIIMEHYRLGSTRAILSRSFCDANKESMETVQSVFSVNMQRLRAYEALLSKKNSDDYEKNKETVKECINRIVCSIKEK